LYKRASRKEIEPDDALLAPVVAAHLGKIRGLVKNSLGLQDEDDVSVEMYDDGAPTPAPVASAGGATAASASVVPAVATTPTLTLGSKLDRQVIYALLGGTMLLMLVLILRRPRQAAAPVVAPVMRVANPPRHEQVLGGTLIDEDDRDAAADDRNGDDIDEDEHDGADSVEAHDMFRRVRDVVEENPEEAARVLRDWIYQGHGERNHGNHGHGR
jgi:flagellar biosynthesis/type III secretory pathway M-ring protein FliF/YscJ